MIVESDSEGEQTTEAEVASGFKGEPDQERFKGEPDQEAGAVKETIPPTSPVVCNGKATVVEAATPPRRATGE